MKNVVIVGGGLAGISTAINLTEHNFNVTLFESSNSLGGRVRSFFDLEFNCFLDNGQHLLIKGYNQTLNLIGRIEAEKNFIFQKHFEVKFIDKKKNQWQLRFSKPHQTLKDLLTFKNLTWKEKLSLINFLSNISKTKENEIENLTVLEFLKQNNQSTTLINNFWKLVVESALNTPLNKASAKIFLIVIKKMFFENPANGGLVIPSKSLYESLIQPAEAYLKNFRVNILKRTKIENVKVKDDYVEYIQTKSGEIYKADFYVLAVHPALLSKFIDNFNPQLNYQTIINVHIKFNDDRFTNKFFAIWDSIIHWVFFHKSHLTIVKSAADDIARLPNEKIIELFVDELISFFPELKNHFQKSNSKKILYRVIKEKRATFLSDLNSLKNRPSTKTQFKNLFLAGDFVDTGLPSTIESAIMSGKLAADEIIFKC
jgi:zeta-carotene desaturase